jgi:hypothetical protein
VTVRPSILGGINVKDQMGEDLFMSSSFRGEANLPDLHHIP